MATIHFNKEGFNKAITAIYIKDGKELDRKVGVMPAEAYTAILDANI